MKMFHRFRRKKVEPLVIPTITETLPQSPHQQQTESFPNALDIHRNATTISNLSSYAIETVQPKDASVEARRRERSIERHADPLGLNIIYAPEQGVRAVDIILVHGLGGTSQKTWSRNRDAQFFWPEKWLPLEPGFEQARILTFGYNAHFASSGRDNILNIADFAKDLLFGMKYSVDHSSQELDVGQVPIIFVAHSMGGLVVKKAFILGQNDNQYREMLASASAILFLSTPHRGTNLAELLNRILTVSVFNHSAKHYIAELKQNSPALQDINEQFRNIAPRMQIFSFFETHPTAVGPKKMMVLEKDSSILGYPDEVSKPLDADHHNVCKYFSQDDPNYVSVRNALRSVIRRVSPANDITHASVTNKMDMNRVETLLAISSPPEDDYEHFQSRWMPGSCEWILQHSEFTSWIEDKSHTSKVLWLHGVPGCGKSVLSAFLVGQLRAMGRSCQYFFFRYGDNAKRTVNNLLRSLAYQIAAQVPELHAQFGKLAEEAVRFEKAESRIIWQKLFLSRLFRLQVRGPLYWIFDALDECDSPGLFLDILSAISSSKIPLRIILVGRNTDVLLTALQRLEASVPLERLAADQTKADLEMFVTREARYMRGDLRFRKRVIKRVCDLAKGNFLWVHLVLKEILQCHTEAAVQEALEELPEELETLYQRMEATLSRTSKPADRELSKMILTWVICAQRALSLEELSEALKPEYSQVLDLRHTISQVCGDFVVIDSKSRVEMVHQTAREYLARTPGLDHSVTPRLGHQALFMKCISCLSSSMRRTRNERFLNQPFLLYAATSWPFHLGYSGASPDHTFLLALSRFFQGKCALTWIRHLAAIDSLKTLVSASQSVTSYLAKKSRIDAESSPLTHRLQEMEVLELWAVDLVKLVGKFGPQLVEHPTSIYTLVPTFCPSQAIISKQHRQIKTDDSILVNGFSLQQWDDCLSKFSVARDCQALKITCLDRHFVILTSDGTLRLFDTITNQPWQKIVHGERILCFKFSASHEKCVTYGFHETKVWLVKQRRQIHSIKNPTNAKALDVAFTSDESAIVSCSDDKCVRRFVLDSPHLDWQRQAGDWEVNGSDGNIYNSPRRVAFNPDGTQVAVAFRGFPLLVWDIEGAEIVGRCERDSDRNKGRHDLHSEIGPVCWNPATGHILGLYKDGCIFQWHPLEVHSQEIRTVETGIQCSPDGSLFVTCNSDGALKVWNFHHHSVIYQLSCHSPVTDMALGADSRRIYDLRESFCNIWEPNALIRLAEADEKASETSSTMGASTQLSLASEGPVELSEPLTALAIAPRTSLYCSGDDVGVVRLSGSGIEGEQRITQGFMPVDYIIWSDDEEYLVTADLGGRLNVRRRESAGNTSSARRYPLLFEAKTGNGLRQILLSQSAEYLLIVTVAFTELWSLKAKAMVATKPNTNAYSRWINHPLERRLILQCTAGEIGLFQWSDMAEAARFQLEEEPDQVDLKTDSEPDASRRPSNPYPMSPDNDHDTVDEVFTSPNGSHLVMQVSSPSAHRQRISNYLVINVHTLSVTPGTRKPTIGAMGFPRPLTERISRILGFASRREPRRPSYGQLSEAKEPDPEDALVFLDHDNWVCSCPFGGDLLPANVKSSRHFFLPQDWLNVDGLRLATVSRDGRFYCPRNGEVAVVSNWLQNEWVD